MMTLCRPPDGFIGAIDLSPSQPTSATFGLRVIPLLLARAEVESATLDESINRYQEETSAPKKGAPRLRYHGPTVGKISANTEYGTSFVNFKNEVAVNTRAHFSLIPKYE